MEGNGKKFAQLTATMNILMDPRNPRRILKWTAHAGTNSHPGDEAHLLTYDGKPGFKDTYSCDPDSADYKPSDYNRYLTYLHDKGKALDVPLAQVCSRRLRDRWALLSPKLRAEILRKLLHP